MPELRLLTPPRPRLEWRPSGGYWSVSCI
jgi:hypothetical protein